VNVTVIGGSGYVGFITGLGFAELGNRVTCVDIDAAKVNRMAQGESPIYEEGVDLSGILQRNLEAGRIRFTQDLQVGNQDCEVIFVAVGTPEKKDWSADLSHVIDVAEELARHLSGYTVIVLKSTVPVGTAEVFCSVLGRRLARSVDFDLAANPEFLREGKGLFDFFNPSRIVVGADSDRAREVLRKLYMPFLSGASSQQSDASTLGQANEYTPCSRTPLVETSISSAQMIKYASNAFLATRVSFINEIAAICERVGADVKEVARGMGYDPRIGPDYLEAGIGFGGPCLEKDLKALVAVSTDHGYRPNFFQAVLSRNEEQVEVILAKVKELIGGLLYRRTVAVYGLAFKAGTNDVRSSVAMRIVEQLLNAGVAIRAFDPVAIPEARELLPQVEYFQDPYEAAATADGLIVLSEWSGFAELDYGRIREAMAHPKIVDGKNALHHGELDRLGFQYRAVGRKSAREL